MFAVEPWRLKTAFDIDLEGLEEKPWREEGVDVSDYFNYGHDEQAWIQYAKKQDRVRRNLLYKEFLERKKKQKKQGKKMAKKRMPPSQPTMVPQMPTFLHQSPSPQVLFQLKIESVTSAFSMATRLGIALTSIVSTGHPTMILFVSSVSKGVICRAIVLI